MRFVILLLLLSNAGLSNAQSSRAGQDRALFFAVEDYAYMPALSNPRQNAQDIATELKEHYGFEVEVIANPTIDEIDKTLSEYAARYADGTYSAQGQLFLFFSGHGVQEGRNGYFMASDSDPGRPQRTAMEYDYYRSQIDQINCQHILVAIDACHSATFDPNHGLRNDNRRFRRKGEAAYDRILANHQSYRARCFWTSDGLGEETPDRSTFAYQILEGLRSHAAKSGYLRSSELFSIYVEKAAPLPGGGNFGSDEPASCFLFFQTASNVIDDRTAWQQARDTDTAPAYRQYLQQYPNGDFRSLAENRLAELEAEERELLAWETAKRTHNREAYQNFIDAYPNSLYRELAEHQRDGLTFMPSNMVLIKGGTFQMGSTEGGSNEKTVHTVTLDDFHIGRFEVTFREYDAYCEATGKNKLNDQGWGRAQRPVINVSWHDAVAYCNWRSKQEGYQPVYTIRGDEVTADWGANGYRLPTEAEWEFAARERGKEVRFGNGKDIARASELNFDAREDYKEPYSEAGIYRKQTVSVSGLNSPNRLNLYDMSGNVWEWCWDWFDVFYRESPSRNPRGPSTGSVRVLRGGSWIDRPTSLRCTGRYANSPDFKLSNIGFRLARTTQ